MTKNFGEEICEWSSQIRHRPWPLLPTEGHLLQRGGQQSGEQNCTLCMCHSASLPVPTLLAQWAREQSGCVGTKWQGWGSCVGSATQTSSYQGWTVCGSSGPCNVSDSVFSRWCVACLIHPTVLTKHCCWWRKPFHRKSSMATGSYPWN